VNAPNNIKLATFIILRAAHLKTEFFCEAHQNDR